MDTFEYSFELSIRCALFFYQLVTAYLKPRIRKIHDDEWWLYTNPRTESYVPSYILLIVTLTNMLVFPLFMLIINRKKLNICSTAIMGYTLATLLSISVTNTLKLLVGRPRPDYYYRCFVDGKRLTFCNGDEDAILEGLKSFPSGHSSLSMVSFGFISLFFIGQLRVFAKTKVDCDAIDVYSVKWKCLEDGRFLGCKFLICLTPFFIALLICMTRLVDFHHHFEDVSVGAAIGLIIAFACYRLYFPSIWDRNCNYPRFQLKSKKAIKTHSKTRENFNV